MRNVGHISRNRFVIVFVSVKFVWIFTSTASSKARPQFSGPALSRRRTEKVNSKTYFSTWISTNPSKEKLWLVVFNFQKTPIYLLYVSWVLLLYGKDKIDPLRLSLPRSRTRLATPLLTIWPSTSTHSRIKNAMVMKNSKRLNDYKFLF